MVDEIENNKQEVKANHSDKNTAIVKNTRTEETKSPDEKNNFGILDLLSFYSGYFKSYKLRLFGEAILLANFVVFTDILVPLNYKKVIDLVTESGLVDKNLVIGGLLQIFIAIIIYYLVGISSESMAHLLGTRTQTRISRDISNDVFLKISKHSYRFFTTNFAGALVAKFSRLISGYESLHERVFNEFWRTLIHFAIAFFILAKISFLMGIILMIWVTLYLGVTYFISRKRVSVESAEAAEESKLWGYLSDNFSNALTVKIFGKLKDEKAKFFSISTDLLTASKKAWDYRIFRSSMQAFMVVLLELSGLYLSFKLWMNGQISTGDIILIQALLLRIAANAWTYSRFLNGLFQGLASAEEMMKILNAPVEIVDPTNPEKCKIKQGQIEFKNVSFSYLPPAPTEGQLEHGTHFQKQIFQNFNCKIISGQKVGIVGKSGGGKSTLIKLLLRFFDPTPTNNSNGFGQILIDDQNIKNILQEDLRAQISFIPQEPVLFHRSILENIAYGSIDRSLDDILDAAKKAHAHDFIQKLPQKYETLVGERGVKLSGGERQRIAIARAMLKKTPILILDEATSALDSESENFIQSSFEQLMSDRTTLVIAHRLSTIQKMDRILVIENGEIIEDGSPAELLKREKYFFQMVQNQKRGFIK